MCYKPRLRTSCPNVRRDARTATNRASPEVALGRPRRRISLARLRSPVCLRSLPAGLLATLARHCPPPLLGSSHGSLRAWLPFGRASRYVRHPDRAVCCDTLCRLPRSLNQALRAVSPRPASLRSPAPRPATAVAFASLRRRAKPLPIHYSSALRRWHSGFAAVLLLPPCNSSRIVHRSPPASHGSRYSRRMRGYPRDTIPSFDRPGKLAWWRSVRRATCRRACCRNHRRRISWRRCINKFSNSAARAIGRKRRLSHVGRAPVRRGGRPP
jgi:hypothetical protein